MKRFQNGVKKTNKQTNEQTNKRINEQTNKRTNEQTNKQQTNKQTNKAKQNETRKTKQNKKTTNFCFAKTVTCPKCEKPLSQRNYSMKFDSNRLWIQLQCWYIIF